MSRFGAQGPGGAASYFGQQDLVAAVAPVIISVVAAGATPNEGETGVVINGTDFGTNQGTVTYNGLAVTVTNWTDTAITVTWPTLAFDASPNAFATDYGLIVADSAPFVVQTGPDPAYQYVLIGTREPSLPVNEALFDDDTLGTGDTYVYGTESPVDGLWDFTGLAEWYINAVPNGGTFTYRLWDVALGQWSSLAIEDFTIVTDVRPGGLYQDQVVDAPALVVAGAVSPGELEQLQVVDASGITQDHQLEAGELNQDQVVDAPAVIVSGAVSPGELEQLQALENVFVTQDHQLSPLDLVQLQAVDAVVLEIAGILNPTALAQIQALDAVVLQQQHQLQPGEVFQVQVIGGAQVSIPSDYIAPGRAVIVAPRSRALKIMQRLRAYKVER